jgi:hypothetical protein
MNDVIAPKQPSLRPKLVDALMFLKLDMTPMPNNPTNVSESPIRNTLIPSRLELPNDIDDSDDGDNDSDDDLPLVPIDSEEADYAC